MENNPFYESHILTVLVQQQEGNKEESDLLQACQTSEKCENVSHVHQHVQILLPFLIHPPDCMLNTPDR